MSPTHSLEVNHHSMQTKKGNATVKCYNSDSDASYRTQSPVYSPPRSPSPASSESTATTVCSSLSRYQPPAKRNKVSEPVNWETNRSTVSSDTSQATEPTSWPASLRSSIEIPDISEGFQLVSLTSEQREQALSTGFITNLSVTPSVRRVAEIREELLKARDLNDKTRQKALSLRATCFEKERQIKKALDLVDLQLEEKKIETLGRYRELFASPWKLTKQISDHISCFDKEGKQICFHSAVEVTSPFKEEPETGLVVQVLENNLVLVCLSSTNKVTGFFGSEILLI